MNVELLAATAKLSTAKFMHCTITDGFKVGDFLYTVMLFDYSILQYFYYCERFKCSQDPRLLYPTINNPALTTCLS